MALPRAFALKSSYNNKYLSFIEDSKSGSWPLLFSADEVSSLTTFEVENAKIGNGLVHLKCNNKYLRSFFLNHNYIAAEAEEPEEDQSKWSCTLFKPLPVVDGGGDGGAKNLKLVLLVRNKELSHEPYSHCLSSAVETQALRNLDIFTVTNLVPVSREISGIQFRLNEAKITDQTTIDNLARGVAQNNNEKSNASRELTLEYDITETGSWKLDSSLAKNSDIITNFNSAVPVIVNGKIQLSGDELLTGPYEWGQPLESSYRVKTTYKVVVPPKKRVIVTLHTTKATFEVPFSYTVGETLADGRKSSHAKDGGVYTGVKFFNFRYDTK